MTAGLAAFQDAFARALLDPAAPAPAAFDVYRNTVARGCIDALRANFPAVARLVGEEWFRAAAARYLREHPPRVPMLLEYGDRFPDFLAAFAPARELPYLAAVARLDRYWTEAHAARDEAALDAARLAGLAPERLAALRLRPHAAARWAWFELPAFTIWSRQRKESAGGDDASPQDWRAEGALLARPADAVRWVELGSGGCAFLDACAAGATLEDAALAARGAEPEVDLAALLARLLEAGAFADDREADGS